MYLNSYNHGFLRLRVSLSKKPYFRKNTLLIAMISKVNYYFAWKFRFGKCMYLLNHSAVLYLLSNLVKLECFRHSARNRHHCE